MPETAATVGLNNPFDPIQAIAASARLLGDLVRRFGNPGLAAAAYNAGPRRIQDWLAKKGKLPDRNAALCENDHRASGGDLERPVTAKLAAVLPREAPCQERVTLIAAKADGSVSSPNGRRSKDVGDHRGAQERQERDQAREDPRQRRKGAI